MRTCAPEHDGIMGFKNAADSYYVSSVSIGAIYGIQFSRSRYTSLRWWRYGWRPTKRWAARVCARKVTRWRNNWHAIHDGKVDPMSDPFEILASKGNKDLADKVKKDLQKTVRELSK